MLNHEHTVVFGSCNISATSETVGPHSANVGKNVLSPTAKLISDYLIESEIDLTGEILCLDAMDQVYDLLLLFMYNSFCDWSGLLDRAIKKI